MAKNNMGKSTKLKILDSAQIVFNRKGFDNTSVEEIAELAGVTKMMVYYHFESKENLMLELVKRLLDSVRDKLHDKISSGAMADVNLMKGHYSEMIDLWSGSSEIVTFILTTALKDPVMFARLQDILKPFYDELIGIDNDNPPSCENWENYFKIFFFNTIPMIFYSIYKDNYMKKYELGRSRMDEIFIDNFIRVLINNTKGNT